MLGSNYSYTGKNTQGWYPLETPEQRIKINTENDLIHNVKPFLLTTGKIITGIVLLITFFAQIGCSSAINRLHSKEITQGCETINATAKLGYFNQEGNGSACKAICSPELPKGYRYSYDNGMCKVQVSVE